MNILHLLLLALAGSVVSLLAGVLLTSNKRLAAKVANASGPFAAGALISAVFFDLIPEALELSSNDSHGTLFWVVIGIVAFFLLERRLSWFHHHHEHGDNGAERRRLPAMLIIGDSLHNALDGVAIGFAYLADPAVGVVTTLAVALHELPQEIGDFGLLLKSGWSRKSVLLANLLSAFSTVVAATAVYFIGNSSESLVAPALAVVAGTLLYIALSDVVPTVHETKPARKWIDNASLLIVAGAVVVWGAVALSHNFIHEETEVSETFDIDH